MRHLIPHYDELENGFIRLRAIRGSFYGKMQYSNRLNDYAFIGGILTAVHPFGILATISWNYTPDGFEPFPDLITHLHDIKPDSAFEDAIINSVWQPLDLLCDGIDAPF